jgi:hypothetical protein
MEGVFQPCCFRDKLLAGPQLFLHLSLLLRDSCKLLAG